MITYADKSMVPVLKDMWHVCFGDDMAYIDFYFKRRFREDNMLVYLDEEKKPVSMMSLLPAELVLKEGRVKRIHYIYAGATYPKNRNNGYYKSLLMHAVKKAEAAGEALVLVPADEKLRGYYHKQGFVDTFKLSKVSQKTSRPALISMESRIEDMIAEEADAFTYKRLRDAYFTGEGYVRWDMEAVQYAVDEVLFCMGGCRKLTYKGREYGVLYHIDKEGRLCIKEITASLDEASVLLKKLAGLLGHDEFEYAVRACSEEAIDDKTGIKFGEPVNYAMSSMALIGLREGYFNLSLG